MISGDQKQKIVDNSGAHQYNTFAKAIEDGPF